MYLQILPTLDYKKYLKHCSNVIEENLHKCHHMQKSLISSFESNTAYKEYPEKYLGELCDYLISLIVLKIYCDDFDYDHFGIDMKSLSLE